MGKYDSRYTPQQQPKPLKPPEVPMFETPEVVERTTAVAAVSTPEHKPARPTTTRFWAVGRVRYTSKDETQRDAYDGEELIDPLSTDVSSLRANNAVTEIDPNVAPTFLDAAGDEGLDGL